MIPGPRRRSQGLSDSEWWSSCHWHRLLAWEISVMAITCPRADRSSTPRYSSSATGSGAVVERRSSIRNGPPERTRYGPGRGRGLSHEDRCIGCLLGTTCGDILGCGGTRMQKNRLRQLASPEPSLNGEESGELIDFVPVRSVADVLRVSPGGHRFRGVPVDQRGPLQRLHGGRFGGGILEHADPAGNRVRQCA